MSQINHTESLPASAGSFHKFVILFENIITKITRVLHTISCVLLFALMFFTVADVIGRFFFNSPIKGTMEMTEMTVALMIFFTIGYAQIKGDHLEIDFIVTKFRESVQHVLKFIIYTVVTIVLFLLTWQLFMLGTDAQRSNELSGDLGLPLFYVIFPVAVASIGFALSYLAAALKSLSKVVAK